eukprot:scaffold4635_cov267-Pinguiococcus_pyrenoidosus.AAC.29
MELRIFSTSLAMLTLVSTTRRMSFKHFDATRSSRPSPPRRHHSVTSTALRERKACRRRCMSA